MKENPIADAKVTATNTTRAFPTKTDDYQIFLEIPFTTLLLTFKVIIAIAAGEN